MDIRFFDFDFNRLGEFPKFISLNYEKNFCGFGTAEVHFSIDEKDLIEILDNNAYLFFSAGSEFAIVTGWKIGEDIAVFARTPEWLLTKRGVEQFECKDTPVTELVCKIVSDNAGDMLSVEETALAGQNIDYLTDGVKTLHDVVCDILGQNKLGFKVDVDLKGKQLVFRMISGEDTHLMVSKSNRTAFDFEYTLDIQDSVSASGWYERKYEDKGEWNASKNSPTLQNGRNENFYKYYEISDSHYNRFNLNCVEGEYLFCDNPEGIWKTSAERPQPAWVYMKNTEVEGLKRWDAVLSGTKIGLQGETEIKDMIRQQTVTAELKQAEYGIDYKLGDVVCVQVEFGKFKKTEKKQVTSVSIFYDTDKCGVIPMLSSMEE